MDNVAADTSAASSVLAILEGGPATLPEASRVQAVSPFIQKIKISHYGGYEHFERIESLGESGPRQGTIFRWTSRTEIAELIAALRKRHASRDDVCGMP
jgi:Family of unknown function (DUF5988)